MESGERLRIYDTSFTKPYLRNFNFIPGEEAEQNGLEMGLKLIRCQSKKNASEISHQSGLF